MKVKDIVFAVIFAVFEGLAVYAYMKFGGPYIAAVITGGVLALLWAMLRAEAVMMPAGKPCQACGTMAKHGAKFCGSCGAKVKSTNPVSMVLDIIFFRWA